MSLPAGRWLAMTGLILVCLVPFAALGILIGHLLTADSVGPALGLGVGLLAFLGGTWFPFAPHSFLADLGQFIPSYWLVQAGHVGFGESWSIDGAICILAWTIVLTALAARAYRRDTGRV